MWIDKKHQNGCSKISLLEIVSRFLKNFLQYLHRTKGIVIYYSKAFDCVDHNKLWKILKEMRVPDHLTTCLLRKLYVSQEATVWIGPWTTDWFKTGRGIHQGCMLWTWYLSSMQRTSWESLGWMSHQLESRLPGETATASDMQMIQL